MYIFCKLMPEIKTFLALIGLPATEQGRRDPLRIHLAANYKPFFGLASMQLRRCITQNSLCFIVISIFDFNKVQFPQNLHKTLEKNICDTYRSTLKVAIFIIAIGDKFWSIQARYMRGFFIFVVFIFTKCFIF